MIVFRYFFRQITQVMLAVSLILLAVALTSRFIQYLGDAVAGRLASDILLLLMLYRLPDFLLVILPLAFFLGILLVYGRMYAENEIVILNGSGFSQIRLLNYTLGIACIFTALMALIVLVLAPLGERRTELLKQTQQQLTEIDLITAGQFQTFAAGDRVTYAERIVNSDSGRQLRNVFVALTPAHQDLPPRIILAESAEPVVDQSSGARLMRMEQVRQYDGVPGTADFGIGSFSAQSLLLPEPTTIDEVLEESTLPTRELFLANAPESRAELQWRISMLLLIPIITLIGVPMSVVSPRQGQYSKLVPAALIYTAYFVLLQFFRDLVAEGAVPPILGLWWIHILFGLIGLLLLQQQIRPLTWPRR